MGNIMSGKNRTLALLGLLAAVSAQPVEAQVRSTFQAQVQRAWLGVSYSTVITRSNGDYREVLVIQEVVGESPAQRAGLEVGDTIVAINDIRATQQLMTSLGGSLEPGDEVRLRIRRNGREQERRVRAGEVPQAYAGRVRARAIYEVDPDELRGRVQIYLDSARRQVDVMPRLFLDSIGPRGFFRDSLLIRTPGDSSFVWRRPGGGGFTWVMPDSGGWIFQNDSTWFRTQPDFGTFRFRMDSIIRFDMDSLRVSMRALGRPDWNIQVDTLFRGPGAYGIAVLGSRAVAGAELTELNPDLGAYFGTNRGVLVVRVPNGTPAEDAGLEAGDVIISVNGTNVGSVTELRREISRNRTGAVRLEVMRRNTRRTIDLRQE
jgi:hypothetical protein